MEPIMCKATNNNAVCVCNECNEAYDATKQVEVKRFLLWHNRCKGKVILGKKTSTVDMTKYSSIITRNERNF